MGHFLAPLLPHAVAVALSPMPIAALILLLLSKRAKLNSTLFLVGWVLGIVINVAFFAFLLNEQQSVTHNGKTIVGAIINGALGVFLIILALKQWKNRTQPGEIAQTPKWMKTIESISPLNAFFVAFLLITLNAKNTILNIATGVTLSQTAQSADEMVTGIAVYTFIASATILFPVLAFLFMGDRLNGTLQKTKTWFIDNSATILFVLFLILGVSLLSKAFM